MINGKDDLNVKSGLNKLEFALGHFTTYLFEPSSVGFSWCVFNY